MTDRRSRRDFGGDDRRYGPDIPHWDRYYGFPNYPSYGYGPGTPGAGFGGPGAPVYGQGEFGYRRYGDYGDSFPQTSALSDDDIRNHVYDALDDDPRVPEQADIRVEVQDRAVTLTGTVRSRHTKRAAWDAAWSAPGVSDVHNNLSVISRRLQAQQRQDKSN